MLHVRFAADSVTPLQILSWLGPSRHIVMFWIEPECCANCGYGDRGIDSREMRGFGEKPRLDLQNSEDEFDGNERRLDVSAQSTFKPRNLRTREVRADIAQRNNFRIPRIRQIPVLLQ